MCRCGHQGWTLPDSWNEARLSYLHKKGSKTEVPNYRPISLISLNTCGLLFRLLLTLLRRVCRVPQKRAMEQGPSQGHMPCLLMLQRHVTKT